jgi:hypothetical protein
MTREVLVRPMAKGLSHKVAGLPHVSVTMAVSIISALKACPFGDADRKLVTAALEARLSKPSSPVTATVNTSKGQVLLAITEYLTAKDWAVIDNPVSTSNDVSLCVIARLHKLGMSRIHEQTARYVVALLACKSAERSRQFPSYVDIHNNLLKFKQDFYNTEAALAERLDQYPTSPRLLPTALYDQAYDDIDPPISVVVPRLHVVAQHHIPMRSSSKLLRGSSGSALGASRDDAPLTLGALRELMSDARNQKALPITLLGEHGERQHGPREVCRAMSLDGMSPCQFRPTQNSKLALAGPPATRVSDAVVATPSVATLPMRSDAPLVPLCVSTPTGGADAETTRAPELGTAEAEELALTALLDRDARRDAERKEAAKIKKAQKKHDDRVTAEKKDAEKKAAKIETTEKKAAKIETPVMRRPASATSSSVGGKRPTPSTTPTQYLQGKLYVDEKQKRVRAYKHVGDKVESSFGYKSRAFPEAWASGCEAIERAQLW